MGVDMMPDYCEHHIRVRAYFLSEERRRLGLPPDPLADWCQAEREFGLAPATIRSRTGYQGFALSPVVIMDIISDLFRIPDVFRPLTA